MSFIIFSVYQNGNEENELNTDNVSLKLQELSIKHKMVEGCYKGVIETSILVDGKPLTENLVIDFCRHFKQESYLRVDNNRNAELVYLRTGHVEPIGLWQNVCKSVALQQDAYTKEQGVDGNYFIASKNIYPSQNFKR